MTVVQLSGVVTRRDRDWLAELVPAIVARAPLEAPTILVTLPLGQVHRAWLCALIERRVVFRLRDMGRPTARVSFSFGGAFGGQTVSEPGCLVTDETDPNPTAPTQIHELVPD